MLVRSKEICIYDTFRLSKEEVVIKIQTSTGAGQVSIAFSDDDTTLAVVSDRLSFIKKFDVNTGQPVGEGITEKPTRFLQCRFIREERENPKGNLPGELYENKLYVVCSANGQM